ncbi:superoxide dismutase [Hypoxylon sp. NC1633]|nr:superoxide dismutase [Hypoxylon sp. NC1633]
MRVSNIISLSAIGASTVLAQNNVTGQLGDAAVTTGNPPGKAAIATLPEKAFWKGSLNGNVKGYISAKSAANGVGIDYELSVSNLPAEGGPFVYHIHVAPVPENGNCTSALAHLDQYVRGEDPACDPARPQSCQQGDLSGKYGKISSSEPYTARFHDPYTSLTEGVGSYFGNRSFVFHFANKTRITCANFAVINTNTTTNTTTSYPSGTVSVPYPTGTGSTPYPTSTGTPSQSSPSATSTITQVPYPAAGSVLSAAKHLAIVPVVVGFLALL